MVSTTEAARTVPGGAAARVLVLVAALAVLAGIGVAHPGTAQAISAGTRADDTASAFAVRIDINRTATTTWTCSGSLIAPELVLTAAHCLYSHNPSDWSLTFAAGPGKVEKRGVRAVLPYSADAGAGPVTSVDDLGLVQLDRPVTDRAPVRLDRAGTLDRLAGTRGPVVEIGYGGVQPTTTPVAERAGQLVVSTATTLPAGGVASLAPLVETGPAATPTVPAGACEPGDSGGPLIAGDDPTDGPVLLGVTSRGSETGHCWFTRVDSASPYRTWLDDKVTRYGGATATGAASSASSATAQAATSGSPAVTTPAASSGPAAPSIASAAAPATTQTATRAATAATPAVRLPAAGTPLPAAAPTTSTTPATPARDAGLADDLGGLARSVVGRLAVGAPVAPSGVTSTGGGSPLPILAPVSASGAPPWATGR